MFKWLIGSAAAVLGISAIADYVGGREFNSTYSCIVETSSALQISTEKQLDEVIHSCENK